MAGQLPPHDLDAEEAVLGSILIDGVAMDKIIGTLLPADFYAQRNRWIYSAMLNLRKRESATDQITVAQELTSAGQLADAGGAAYLSQLIVSCPTSLDIEHYALIVRNMAISRTGEAAGDQISAMFHQAPKDLDKAIDSAMVILQTLRSKIQTMPRKLEILNPRIVETEPAMYIWNVNGHEMRMGINDITEPGRFKKLVIATCGFVPVMPKAWDDILNTLLGISTKIEAPEDASEEYQLKALVQQYKERKQETNLCQDLKMGFYLIREIKGKQYFCFQSTPLLAYLKKQYNRVFKSNFLWVTYISKWGGIRNQFKAKGSDGTWETTSTLWCLPLSFLSDVDVKVETIKPHKARKPSSSQQPTEQLPTEQPQQKPPAPDDF